jgi:glutathione synthase/RimK-type ligase-like ATP-grasp enzyme
MKILMLYNSFEWCEQQMVKYLRIKKHVVDQKHVNDFNFKYANEYDIILNRVMPSVANVDIKFDLVNYVLNLMSLHGDTIFTNSCIAAIADCDKRFSSKRMKYAGVSTPKIYEIEEIKYPVIVKPVMSGRCVGLEKCDNEKELKKFKSFSGYILQEFVESILPFDYRICVCNGEILFGFTRSLINGWMGAVSKGSKTKKLDEIPQPIKNIAIAASISIKADINGVDIIMTEDGPTVIENNPTPNFSEPYINMLGFNPVERIIDKLF